MPRVLWQQATVLGGSRAREEAQRMSRELFMGTRRTKTRVLRRETVFRKHTAGAMCAWDYPAQTGETQTGRDEIRKRKTCRTD